MFNQGLPISIFDKPIEIPVDEEIGPVALLFSLVGNPKGETLGDVQFTSSKEDFVLTINKWPGYATHFSRGS